MAFEKLLGNEVIKNLLSNAIETNHLLHSYLFVGNDGIGKSLFAKEFSKMILCFSETDKPCHECKSCKEFEGESHPDFLQIDSEDGKTIKIEQIRFLQGKIAEKPVTSAKKVYIINDCDLMTREAANSLLKTLEEPPTYAILILITTNESKLLATIRSRCTKIAFLPVSDAEIRQYLSKYELEENMTDNMIKQCNGSIGRAIKIQSEKENYRQVEEVVKSLEKDNITQIWKKAEVFYKEKDKILDLLDYTNVVLYDLFGIKQKANYLKAIPIVETVKKRILANANYDMSIDYLLLKLWEEFA